MAYLFIAHDLRVVVRLVRRLAVLDAGRIVTVLDLDRPPQAPMDPALQRMIDAVPAPLVRAPHRSVGEWSVAPSLTSGIGDG
jgi:ABC-type oligopeptide transport system ATPase subunit